jgi:hypothetical protein
MHFSSLLGCVFDQKTPNYTTFRLKSFKALLVDVGKLFGLWILRITGSISLESFNDHLTGLKGIYRRYSDTEQVND